MGKAKRSIIKIDEDKCNGCGLCIPGCPEGALKIVDTPKGPKARLAKENFCDGLGACLGNCPQGALTVEEKPAEAYDEDGVIEHIKKTAPDKLAQHMEHLRKHGMLNEQKEAKPKKQSPCGCPGSAAATWGDAKAAPSASSGCSCGPEVKSELRQWPVQLSLVNTAAPYFQDADLVIAADCVPFAYANFHEKFLKGKAVIIGCPKLDDAQAYLQKLTELFQESSIKSVTVVHMEVPCCFGLAKIVKQAISESGKLIPYCEANISIKGEIKTA